MSLHDLNNAVGSLNRRCQLYGTSASFDLVKVGQYLITNSRYKMCPQVEGPSHRPVFTVQAALFLGDQRLTALGHGGNKKSAKDDAARIMLQEIDRYAKFITLFIRLNPPH